MMLVELATGLWVDADLIAAVYEQPHKVWVEAKHAYVRDGVETRVYLRDTREGAVWTIHAPISDVLDRLALAGAAVRTDE